MKSMLSTQSIVAITKEQASCDLAGEAVILNFKDNIYYGLDAVGALVWNLINKPMTIDEIKKSVLNNFDVEPESCERDLLIFLQQMADKGLIEIKNETVA